MMGLEPTTFCMASKNAENGPSAPPSLTGNPDTRSRSGTGGHCE